MTWHNDLIILGCLSCIIVTRVEKSWSVVGNLTCDAVLAFLIQICTLVSTNQLRCLYYFTKVSFFVLSKTNLGGVFPLSCLHCYPLKMADFYCACIVPRLVNKLYSCVVIFVWRNVRDHGNVCGVGIALALFTIYIAKYTTKRPRVCSNGLNNDCSIRVFCCNFYKFEHLLLLYANSFSEIHSISS